MVQNQLGLINCLIVFWIDLLLFSQDWLEITVRLVSAIGFGALIGWEREIRNKAAGLRTHMLVSLGAALFVLIPIMLSPSQQEYEALSRTIQGVATGIGFLGAGEIWRDTQPQKGKNQVHGLTSAAAIWVAAALGAAAGCGLWQMGLLGGILTLIVLRLIKQFEHYF